MSQLAISWVLSHPEITLAISGADNANQIEEVSKSVEVKLSDEHLEKLNYVSRRLRLDLDLYLGMGDTGEG